MHRIRTSEIASENEPYCHFADGKSVTSVPDGGIWLQDKWSRALTVITTGPQEALVEAFASIGKQLAWYKRNSTPEHWVSVLAIAREHPLLICTES